MGQTVNITLYCKHPGCTKSHRFHGPAAVVSELLDKVPMRHGEYHFLCPKHRRKRKRG